MVGMMAEYERGLAALRGRIREINDRLAGRAPMKEGETVKTLETRRYLLYCEAAEMEQAIRAMGEYLRRDRPRRRAG